jgi:membrane-associated phospholipid phosphatase
MTTTLKSQMRHLRPVDMLVIVFTNLLSVLGIYLSFRTPVILLLVPINLLLSFIIIWIARNSSESLLRERIHDWYAVPIIFLIFKEVYVVIQAFGRPDWDNILIAADRALFGTDPTVWCSQFATPVLTELMQIAYTSYYFIMIVTGIELYMRSERRVFHLALFSIVYGFALSYIGYLLFPAVGPRFTLHDFRMIDSELPGLWLTTYFRDFINAGESISKDALNPIAIAQRDVFPSGHTQMTLISLYFAFRYRIRSRFILLIFGSLLIISTVYLRYHYVVDVIGGVAFMWFTIWSAPKLFGWGELQQKNNSPTDNHSGILTAFEQQ